MGDGAHPFYTSQQQQLPSADELQLSAQLSRNVAPNMTGNISDGQEMVPSNQPAPDMRQQVSAEELAQGGLDPNHDPSFGDPTPRKRSKVSRACDECRRKKVSNLFLYFTCLAPLMRGRFVVMRRPSLEMNIARIVSVSDPGVSSAGFL